MTKQFNILFENTTHLAWKRGFYKSSDISQNMSKQVHYNYFLNNVFQEKSKLWLVFVSFMDHLKCVKVNLRFVWDIFLETFYSCSYFY